MWKAAAAFMLAIGAGGFVVGSVLGDSSDPPGVGEPVIVGESGSSNSGADAKSPPKRSADDDRPDDRGDQDDGGDDGDVGKVWHEPKDVDDDADDGGSGANRGDSDDRDDRGSDDDRDDRDGSDD